MEIDKNKENNFHFLLNQIAHRKIQPQNRPVSAFLVSEVCPLCGFAIDYPHMRFHVHIYDGDDQHSQPARDAYLSVEELKKEAENLGKRSAKDISRCEKMVQRYWQFLDKAIEQKTAAELKAVEEARKKEIAELEAKLANLRNGNQNQ